MLLAMSKNVTKLAILVLSFAGFSIAGADDPDNVVMDPNAPYKAKYEVLRDVVNGELEALGQDYSRRIEQLSTIIDAQRLSQLDSVTDVFERNQVERALSRLKQRSISELQRELGKKRRMLNDMMRESSSALSRDGVVDPSAWQSITSFSAENLLQLPEEILELANPGVEPDNGHLYTGFAAAIYNCANYEEQFVHPFTGDSLTRRVVGPGDDSCRVEEGVPGNMLMVCNYSFDRLPAVADFYAHPEKLENAKVSSSTRLVDGEPVTTTIYTIDGKEVSHPVNEALAAGECAVMREKVAKERPPST